jgi:phage terminase large subunit-like protein
MRPDTSPVPERRACHPALSSVVAQLAVARDQPASGARSSRLGDVVAGLAQAARREIVVLRRENAALTSHPELAGPG